jgi:hypothetical protein
MTVNHILIQILRYRKFDHRYARAGSQDGGYSAHFVNGSGGGGVLALLRSMWVEGLIAFSDDTSAEGSVRDIVLTAEGEKAISRLAPLSSAFEDQEEIDDQDLD